MTNESADNYNGMVNGPIYLDASLAHLFGEGIGAASDQSSSFEGELKDIFADGVIDQRTSTGTGPHMNMKKPPMLTAAMIACAGCMSA